MPVARPARPASRRRPRSVFPSAASSTRSSCETAAPGDHGDRRHGVEVEAHAPDSRGSASPGSATSSLEPLEPVRAEVDRGPSPSRISSAIACADRGRLHEAVAREAAGRVDAVGDPPEDRVGVGRHVVEPGPGLADPAAGGRREAVRQPLEPVVEDRLVDGRLEAPARLGVAPSRARAGRRGGGSGSRVSASTTIGSRCRQPRRAARWRAAGGRAAESAARRRPARRARPTRGRRRSRACLRRRAGSRRACARAPRPRARAARRTSSRASPRADRRRRPRRRTPPRARRRSRARRRTTRRRARPGTPSDGLELPPRLELGQPRLGRREEQVADLEEERRAELGEERDALAREPHLGRGRELLADAAHRPRGRAAADLAAVAEHDVARSAEREPVGDAGPDRPAPATRITAARAPRARRR